MTDQRLQLIVDACYELVHVLHCKSEMSAMMGDHALEVHFRGGWVSVSNYGVAKSILAAAVKDEIKQITNFLKEEDNTWE